MKRAKHEQVLSLTWKQKHTILQRRKSHRTSERYTNISIVWKWAVDTLKLSKEPSYEKIMRIFQNEESIVEYVASGEAKGKKNSIVQNYGLEMIIREYVNAC